MENEDRARRGPEGGFHFITVAQVCMVWTAYKSGTIRYQDLRAYFACHELAHRRSWLKRDQTPRFELPELCRLLGGVGEGAARVALRRLEATGLLAWSKSALTFARSPEQLSGNSLDAFWAMLNKVTCRKRSVPVPRHILAFIAGGARPVVVATVLGHLLRCLYYRAGQCQPVGTCKASWVADVFTIDERNVKGARAHLENELGWLVPLPSPWWHQNRYGKTVAIDLSWTPSKAADQAVGKSNAAPSKSPPPPAPNGSKSPPPESNNDLSSRSKNQNLGGQAPKPPTGFSKPDRKQERLLPPSFDHVLAQDLSDTARLLALFADCVRRGLVADTERDRLNVFAIAERARTLGAKNPCALFAWLLRGRHWEFITEGYDDAAHRRLKTALYGEPREATPVVPLVEQAVRATSSTPLSDDARFARGVRQVLRNQRYVGDEFTVVRQARPDWTRQRWDMAVQELEGVATGAPPSRPRSVAELLSASVEMGANAKR